MSFYYLKALVTHPTFFERLKCESKSENNGRKNWDTFFNAQHFQGRGVC